MATEARKFQLGLFVILSTVIAIGMLVWLGASRIFEKTDRVVTYLSESVQGLDQGSAVKYRGVPAGRVERIGIAPDEDLIEVVMSVDEEFANLFKKDPNLRAQIQLAGITGLRYVEIDRHTGDALDRHPKLDFEPRYDLILSTPSTVRAVQGALEDVYQRVMTIDFAGISNDIRATLQSATKLLGDERIPPILANLRTTSESVDRIARNVDRMTAGVELRPVVEDLKQIAAQANALITDVQSGQTGADLRTTLDQIGQFAASAQHVMVRFQYSLEQVDRTLANLEQIAEDVRGQPSRLFFAEPPPPRRPGGEAKP